MPQIAGEIVVVFGTAALIYAAERAIVHAGLYEKKDEKSVKVGPLFSCFISMTLMILQEVEDLRKFTNLAIPFVVSSFGYPYQVVSTVMAVAGSG